MREEVCPACIEAEGKCVAYRVGDECVVYFNLMFAYLKTITTILSQP